MCLANQKECVFKVEESSRLWNSCYNLEPILMGTNKTQKNYGHTLHTYTIKCFTVVVVLVFLNN